LAFLAACGSVNETFTINVNTLDAGSDSGPATDATVADGSAPDASSDATVPDGSVQDAQVDAGADAGPGPVVPDGGSVVIVGDAAVVIPPLDPGLLGAADGGIVISDGGLANADGGALTPRQFRDLVNGITCQRVSECCCPGCSAAEQAQTISKPRCETGLGAAGLQNVLIGNELIPAGSLTVNAVAQSQCIALLNGTVASCQGLRASDVATLRAVCLNSYGSSKAVGEACSNAYDCKMPARCINVDGGVGTCAELAQAGEACSFSNDCTARAVQGTPPNWCQTLDAGVKRCAPFLTDEAICPFDIACGAGACTSRTDGAKRCSNSLPFAAQGDPASFCQRFTP
jgi:hypothetical protein